MQTAKQPLSQEYALSPAASRKSGKQPLASKQPACKHRALSPVLAAAIIFITIPAMTEVRIMNINKALGAYGFKSGVFDSSSDIVTEASMNSCDTRITAIEGDVGLADSTEEFLTLMWTCSPVKISYNAQKIVDKELPKGKEGALRLCSMWLLKTAEYPENATAYTNAIAIVKEKAQEKYGVTLTDDEIKDYYAESMRKKVYGTPIKLLTKDEQDKVRELLLAYLLDPTEQNARNFKDFRDSLAAAYPKKGDGIYVFVKVISPEVAIKLS